MPKNQPTPSFNPPLFGAGSGDPSAPAAGVTGQGGRDPGVVGASSGADGVQGFTEASDKNGVVGRNGSNGAFGTLGGSDPVFHQSAGVYGQSEQQGVMGLSSSESGTGVYGGNLKGAGYGVRADIADGVAAVSGKTFGTGAAIQGESDGTGLAGNFLGDVSVTGNITCKDGNVTAKDVILSGGDCAEDFDISDLTTSEPGSVMVLGQNGSLEPCRGAYDKKVAGVISGAGDYKPGIILDKRHCSSLRLPLALLGKVYCKVDADFGPIEVGDLMTTSTNPGYAMKASDPQKAFGSVIGKALQPIAEGQGLIPILVALQ